MPDVSDTLRTFISRSNNVWWISLSRVMKSVFLLRSNSIQPSTACVMSSVYLDICFVSDSDDLQEHIIESFVVFFLNKVISVTTVDSECRYYSG